jgi:hypothetical protein
MIDRSIGVGVPGGGQSGGGVQGGQAVAGLPADVAETSACVDDAPIKGE